MTKSLLKSKAIEFDFIQSSKEIGQEINNHYNHDHFNFHDRLSTKIAVFDQELLLFNERSKSKIINSA